MRQALHILHKDIRALSIPMATAFGLHALYCILRAREQSDPAFGGQLGSADVLAVLLVLGWFSVIAAAVHEEPLPGVRQFWLTRPYSLRALVAAKLCLCVLLVNLPLLVSDVALMKSHGLPVSSALPHLLARQAPNTMLFIAPALVLAVVTSSAASFWSMLFGVIVLTFSVTTAVQQLYYGNGLLYVDTTSTASWPIALLTAAGVFVFWQYRTRSTRMGRATVFAGIVGLPLILAAGPQFTRWFPAPRTISPKPSGDYAGFRISPDLQRAPRVGLQPPPPDFIRFDIPVMLSGLKPRENATGTALPEGVSIQGSVLSFTGAALEQSEEGYWLAIWARADPSSLFETSPADVGVALQVSVQYEQTVGVLRPDVTQYLRGVGNCRASPAQRIAGIVCIAGPREPREPPELTARLTNAVEPTTLSAPDTDLPSPWNVIWGISPLKDHIIPFTAPGGTARDWQIAMPPGSYAEIIAHQPRAQFEAEIRIRGILLSPWQSRTR